MPSTALTLQTLHRILTQLADMRGRLERMPAAVRARKANVTNLQTALDEARETAKQTRLACDRKQLDLKSSEERITDWNGKLNTASSNKEYQTLQEQIAAAEMANSVLADEILELMERVDELDASAGKAAENLEAGQADLKKFAVEVEEKVAHLNSEIDRLEGDLSATEKELPGDYKSEYQRIVRVKGAEGMAPSVDGVCEGCGQSITLNMQNDLKLSKPVFCQSCGALLYPAEER
ncbi:MAG: phospholipase [Planctomycetota bacterium]